MDRPTIDQSRAAFLGRRVAEILIECIATGEEVSPKAALADAKKEWAEFHAPILEALEQLGC